MPIPPTTSNILPKFCRSAVVSPRRAAWQPARPAPVGASLRGPRLSGARAAPRFAAFAAARRAVPAVIVAVRAIRCGRRLRCCSKVHKSLMYFVFFSICLHECFDICLAVLSTVYRCIVLFSFCHSHRRMKSRNSIVVHSTSCLLDVSKFEILSTHVC